MRNGVSRPSRARSCGVADSGNVPNALGEVTETRYNAFGQVSESITYTGRITRLNGRSTFLADSMPCLIATSRMTMTRPPGELPKGQRAAQV